MLYEISQLLRVTAHPTNITSGDVDQQFHRMTTKAFHTGFAHLQSRDG